MEPVHNTIKNTYQMLNIAKILLIFFSSLASIHAVSSDKNGSGASKVEEAAIALGVTKSDLKMIWLEGRCEPDWSFKVSKSSFEDQSLLGYKAVKAGFFTATEDNDRIILSPSEKCVAVNDYYFNDIESDGIKEFIALDKAFSDTYGHSALIAIYAERVEFFSWYGEVSKFNLKFSESLQTKGLYTLYTKDSTFNGKPSKAFSGKRTPEGDAFYNRVFESE